MSSTLTRGLIFKYPLDPTAVNPNNRIVNEEHELGAGLNRAIVPNYSAFYSQSMTVTVEGQLEPLVPNQQYIAAQLHADATASMDREVCMVIVITDPTVFGKVILNYQTVGGEFSISVDALRRAIEDEDLDERTVSWGDIIARPSAFTPAPHLHDIGDLYGFEYVVEALESIRMAILVGDEAIHEEIRQWVRVEDGKLRDTIEETNRILNLHTLDYENPHKVNKAQVGLGFVENLPLASEEDMTTGSSNAHYVTPVRTREAIEHFALVPLNAHIARQDNPHAVTKAQVGLSDVDNFATATKEIMESGTSTNNFVTPLLTKQAIDHHALIPLNAHTARTDNPHGVTKAQVGLSEVQNYGAAGENDARVGTSNTLYMTPLRTAQAIATQALTPLNAHIARVDNPHAVTKAQVALGSVDNFATANETEAREGLVNNRFMTPLRTAQAIATLATGPLTAHINNKSNPHAVTKAQVGLSNIPNAITNSRSSDTAATLLTAKGMFDHVGSGDHDGRYAPKNTAGVDCSVHWNGSGVYIWGGGAWRQVWPAQWQ